MDRDEQAPTHSMQLFSERLTVSAGTFRHGAGERVVGRMKRGPEGCGDVERASVADAGRRAVDDDQQPHGPGRGQ